jgi:uncharacterized protein (DUF433 family)
MSKLATLERPTYSLSEASRLLRVPTSTLRWWLEGRRNYPPVLRLEPTGSTDVTWGEFVEAGLLREYRDRDVPLQRLRPVIEILRERFEIPYPLAHFRPFVGVGRQLLFEAQQVTGLPAELGIVLELVGGQMVLDSRVEAFLHRIDFSDDEVQFAERIHPDGRTSPVVIDPTRSFGSPTLRGIRTDALAELVEAGEPPELIAEEYGLTPEELKAALAYEWQPAA